VQQTLYWANKAFLGSVNTLLRSSFSSCSRWTTHGKRPTNSGMSPNYTRTTTVLDLKGNQAKARPHLDKVFACDLPKHLAVNWSFWILEVGIEANGLEDRLGLTMFGQTFRSKSARTFLTPLDCLFLTNDSKPLNAPEPTNRMLVVSSATCMPPSTPI
jgi:hypothetical protein